MYNVIVEYSKFHSYPAVLPQPARPDTNKGRV